MARKGLSPEAKVGLFVLLGILLLTYMTFRLGKIHIGKKKGYEIYAVFDSVSGLNVKAPVKVAGVRVGEVESINLVNGRARVTMRIEPQYQIPADSMVSVRTQGLLGEKYVEIAEPSQGARYVKPGGTLQETTRTADIDQLVTRLSGIADDVKAVTGSLKKVFGTPEGEAGLKRILDNMDALTGNLNHLVTANQQNITSLVSSLNEVVTANKERLNTIMANTEALTQSLKTLAQNNAGPLSATISNFRQFSASLREETPGLIRNLDNLSQNLQGVVTENRENLKESLANIKTATAKLDKTLGSINEVAQKIDKGQGTIGKLVNDDTAYNNLNETLTGVNKILTATNNFKFRLGLRGEYQVNLGKTKGYFSLKIQPRQDKYYLLEVVDDPQGKISTTNSVTTVNGVTTLSSDQRTQRKLKFTAEFAKRFYNTVIRGGLVESTFGGAVDQLFLKDRLRLTLEGFDFNPDRDQNREPHLKLWGKYDLYKPFFVTAGWDQILNPRLRTVFVGAGFAFDDEDLKYLLTKAPVNP